MNQAASIIGKQHPHTSHGRWFVFPISALLAALLGTVALAKHAAPATDQTGQVLCSYWRELSGTDITDLTKNAAYPAFPDEQIMLDKFEIPENQDPNFGTVISGCVHPPSDGDYIFYIAANNQGELYLSSDSSPDHKALIASVPEWSMPRDWTASPKQTSQPVALKAGGTYYIEARQKNGGGDNHLSIAWKLPGGTVELPIPGNRLSPADAVKVPKAKVEFDTLPTQNGQYAVTAAIDTGARHYSVPLQITLPSGYNLRSHYAALVFLPDAPRPPGDAGGEDQPPTTGPATAPVADTPSLCPANVLHDQPFILISSLLPASAYEKASTARNLAVVIHKLCRHYPIYPGQIAITGVSAGGTEAWRIARESSTDKAPHFFCTIATINGREYKDPALLATVTGSAIRMYADIADGAACECAHRMAEDNLPQANPPPKIIWLGPKELGAGPAAHYCYSDAGFYKELFPPLAPTAAVTGKPVHHHVLRLAAAAVLVLFLIGFLWLRLRRRLTPQ